MALPAPGERALSGRQLWVSVDAIVSESAFTAARSTLLQQLRKHVLEDARARARARYACKRADSKAACGAAQGALPHSIIYTAELSLQGNKVGVLKYSRQRCMDDLAGNWGKLHACYCESISEL